jgi:DNA-binding transcriptional MocR family regulator
MRQVRLDDVATWRTEDVADEENIHLGSVAREVVKQIPIGNDNQKSEGNYTVSMIDLMWNFPLLAQQQATWSHSLQKAIADAAAQSVESQRPSFLTTERGMRERAAAWLGFAVERTWMTCGNHHATLNALMASGIAGTRVALEGASYPGFMDQCRMTKTEMVPCAIDENGLVPEQLRALCEKAKAEGRPLRGLFTMPTVQNPMTFVTPLVRRETIVEIAREFDLVIIEDAAYAYLEEHAPPSYAVLAPERAYYSQGLAKSFAPGARTGFLIAPESASEALVTSLRCTTTGTDVPQNAAALAMCEDGTLERLMREKRIEGAARNREARDLLGGAASPGAECAWHLWVPVASPGEVARAMLERGVMLSDGRGFAVAPEYGLGVRVALGAEIERERAMEGVQVLAEFLRGL